MLTAVAAGSTSCLNEYLDKAPDAGLDEKEVFSKYANFKSYFYAVYNGANFNIKAHYPQWFAGNNQKFTMEGLTDMCDMTRIQRCQPGKQGDGSTVIYAVGYNSDASSKTAKVPYSWKSIRVANMTIRNIDMLQDATDREKKDLLAQAYFVRAYCHFELFRLYGSLPYTVIVSPMGMYRSQHRRHFGGKYKQAGWQGYRFDLAMVFDPGFDAVIDRAVSPVAEYRDDKYLLGYFTDNELPWVNDALDRHLTLLAHDEDAYIAVRKWYDERKGVKDAPAAEITDADRKAFQTFYFDTYMRKVTEALRKYDPNHLYLGCRFNQHHQEMASPEIFAVAGRYMDVISINHYRLWEPDAAWMANWEKWSGKPFIITEFYTKGEDSGLPNNTGAGWNVRTQADRGWFYQNFVTELLRSGNCVGWHWFTYMDNDPQNLKTDPSNRDSNKGVVAWNFEPYTVLLDEMKQLNDCTYRLIRHLDAEKAEANRKTTDNHE